MHRARPFNDSDTAPRGSTTLPNRPHLQVVREAQDNFRMDDDVLAVWHPALGQRQLRLDAALHPPPRTPRLVGFALANGSMSSNGDIRHVCLCFFQTRKPRV